MTDHTAWGDRENKGKQKATKEDEQSAKTEPGMDQLVRLREIETAVHFQYVGIWGKCAAGNFFKFQQ